MSDRDKVTVVVTQEGWVPLRERPIDTLNFYNADEKTVEDAVVSAIDERMYMREEDVKRDGNLEAKKQKITVTITCEECQ